MGNMNYTGDHHPFRNKLTTQLQNDQGPCLPLATDFSPVLCALWNQKLLMCLKLSQSNISLQTWGRVGRAFLHPCIQVLSVMGLMDSLNQSFQVLEINDPQTVFFFSYCLKMHIFRKFGSILFIYFKSFEYKNVAFSHSGIFKSSIPFPPPLKSLILF